MTKDEDIGVLRHSLSHLLAAAVLEVYPNALPTLGPAIENGFYYDFDFKDRKITDSELPVIEKKMRDILKTWDKFEGRETTQEEALILYKDNPYKKELINEIAGKGEKITLYTSGKFTDLCRGGHIKSAKNIKPDSFKLDKIAGAYWRGDEKNQMLTRIYGLAFNDKKELEDYIKQQEEAEKRDHRKLGKELKIFTFDDDVGPGLPLWLPNGAVIIEELEKFSQVKQKDNLKRLLQMGEK